jgi:hypothetical protein
MKISDFIFRYSSHRGQIHDSLCRVRLFYSSEKGKSALLTDIGNKNTGASVTNSIECLRRALIESGHIDENTRLIEHYEEDSYRQRTFDLVTFTNDIPDWQSTTASVAAREIGCGEDETNGRTEHDPRLVRQIEKLRMQIDPHVDRPYQESREVINRRADILRNRIPLLQLRGLVEHGAGEKDLQRLVQSDLSLLGEMYAHPDEEYLAFAEFPLDDGRVDFALFSGRSRMDITLIEIKGAEFYLTTKDSYSNLNAKFNEGRQQITQRLGYVFRNYQVFRSHAHRIREQAERGEQIYRAFIGPKGKLWVDPEKDVNVHYVVIGGRTRDDQLESKLRHEFEISFNPRIRLESWDTWLRKLRRV